MLIEDTDIALAPHDPAYAFSSLAKIARVRTEEIMSKYPTDSWHNVRYRKAWTEYAYTIAGLLNAYDMTIEVSLTPPSDVEYFDEWISAFIGEVEKSSITARLKFRDKANHEPGLTYEAIDISSYKEEISKYTAKIRSIIRAIDIDEHLRELLFDSLNRFERDIDRNRTRWESVLSLYRITARAIGDGAKELEPAIKALERIVAAMEKAASIAYLQAPTPTKLLEGPGDDSGANDDIPF